MCRRGHNLHQQRGNFLFQSLLAVGVIFAFVPFLSRSLSERNIDTRMYSSARQVDIAQTAARIFIRENAKNIAYDTTVVSGNDFSDLLEPYGLPLGYVPRTALGQDIALVIHKTPMSVSAYLELSGGDLSGVQIAELVRRIGFYAAPVEKNIQVGIELSEVYSDVVRRNEPDLENSGFLSDLDMGDYSLDSVGNLFAVRGEFEMAQFDTLSVTGFESGRKARNNIEYMSASRAVFQSKSGESALSLIRGTLYADTVNAKTISMYGDTGGLTVLNASVYDFAMSAGRTNFTGPAKWDVRGNLVSNNISFSTERLDISSYLNTTRGQDVFIDTESLEYSTKSGIETGTVLTSNITMRDQTSTALSSGGTGAVILDIRPAGTTMLPDVLLEGIDNDGVEILASPAADDSRTVNCESFVKKLEGAYNSRSLSQYLICQYLYWQNLERRIDIKQCLMAGRSDCI